MRAIVGAALLICVSSVQAWTYNARTDPMGRGSIKSARVDSSNQVQFDFPYRGPQRGQLMLRVHPEYGKDVMFSIQRGQFLCSSIEPCYVLVRFDDKKPETYRVYEPADHSSNLLFIEGYEHFLRQLYKAKRLRIQASFYQQGNRIFEFNVAGLKWERPASEARPVPAPMAPTPQAGPASVSVQPPPAPSASSSPMPYSAEAAAWDAGVKGMTDCIEEGQRRGLVMDELTAFIRGCEKGLPPIPLPPGAESVAIQEHCAGLTGTDYANTACEIKVSRCERIGDKGTSAFANCMAAP